MRSVFRRLALATTVLVGVVAIPTATAVAATGSDWSTSAAMPAAVIDHIEPITDRWLRVFVNSPAMNRMVQVQVLLPEDQNRPHPMLYLLDGRGAPENDSNWALRGNAVQFFADKDVTVVMTVGGPADLYTDWQHRDQVLGTSKWETFLTSELPPLLDAQFHGDGGRAVEGASMGGEAAMMLAVRHPGMYRAVAAHSGCYSIASEVGQIQARAIVQSFGGNPNNMFGPPGDPDWLAHDAYAHATALRGTAIYLSSGNGLPGPHDGPGQPDLENVLLLGAPLEAGARLCMTTFAARLAQLGIPATVDARANGTHSWPYWADELAQSWPTIANAFASD